MESFFVRYRNLLVLLALLVAQIVGLATQVRRHASGRVGYDPGDGSGVRLIRLWANSVVSPPERLVEGVKDGLGILWESYFDLHRMRQENHDLQATVDRLRLEQASLLEDARQGQRLQSILKFQEKYAYQTAAAQVIGSSGTDLSRVFYIDKGKDDGLARDMAVITPDGIVGKVRDVFPHTAQVLAINDQSSGAGAILETTRIRGILRGNAAGQPQIVGILADQRIKPGENVLTAGGDEIFPRGLPIGVVQKVVPDPDQDGFVDVVVKPAANLDKLDEVLVITSLEPHFSSEQMKDLATSQQSKGAEAAAIDEQKRASQVLSERLPGLTDPNAPKTATPATPGANGAAGPNGTSTASPSFTMPKLIPPQHPDRFTPGYAGGSSSAPDTEQAPRPSEKKPATPRSSDDTSKPAPRPKTTPQTRRNQ